MSLDPTKYITADISAEEWREIDVGGRVYRIDAPKLLIIRKGGSTHRVVDSTGVVHCYAAPETGQSVIRWKAREGNSDVQF